MSQFVGTLDKIIQNPIFILLCLGAGLYFSFSTRFLQVRHFKEMIRLIASGKEGKKGVSSFQAFAIAISARVGTGNIAGVATAITLGGPGAIFWMWVLAFLGSATAFVESTLAQIYKSEVKEEYRGGPAFYIKKGIGSKLYAGAFAVAISIGMGFLLPGIHSNAIASSLDNAFGITPLISGIFITLALGFVIWGGTKRIARAAEILVPIMSFLYIIVALIIIVANIAELPKVIMLIIKSAFGADQAFGGIVGAAITWGVKRGIYSNEAGQGTGAQAAASAEVSHPAKQGLVQAFSVYIDTLLVCSATAFIILMTGMYNVKDSAGKFIVNHLPNIEDGPGYVQYGVDTLLHGFGKGFVAISILLFAFTTLMAYFYYVETNIVFLSKGKVRNYLILVLKIVLPLATLYGALNNASVVWNMGDIAVGIIAWLNIVAILILRKDAFKTLKDYEEQKAAGKNPTFSPKKLGIKNAGLWEKKSEMEANEKNCEGNKTEFHANS